MGSDAADLSDYPTIDWPVAESEIELLRSERKAGRIKFLLRTAGGIGWTPEIDISNSRKSRSEA